MFIVALGGAEWYSLKGFYLGTVGFSGFFTYEVCRKLDPTFPPVSIQKYLINNNSFQTLSAVKRDLFGDLWASGDILGCHRNSDTGCPWVLCYRCPLVAVASRSCDDFGTSSCSSYNIEPLSYFFVEFGCVIPPASEIIKTQDPQASGGTVNYLPTNAYVVCLYSQLLLNSHVMYFLII